MKCLLVFPTPLPACFKTQSLRYSCSVLPLQALCKYSCPPLPAGCWSILQAYICSLLSVSSVVKLNAVMYTTTVFALLNRKVAHTVCDYMVYDCDWAICKQAAVSEHSEWLNKRTDGTAEHRGFFCTVGSPPVLPHHYDNTLMFLQHMLLSNALLGAPHCQAEDHLCRSSRSAFSHQVKVQSSLNHKLWNTSEERRSFYY